MKIVLASNNKGKIHEFNGLLKNLQLEVVPQAELNVTEIEETGLSFVENALLKARHAAQTTGLPALADDSGLVVPALNGAPGIYSARYAGKQANSQQNIEKLLTELKLIPDDQLNAYFYCVLVFMSNASDPTPLICEAKWAGNILRAPQGKEGFGYDPIFYVPELNKSAAELPLALKNSMSHRYKASQLLIKCLPDKL